MVTAPIILLVNSYAVFSESDALESEYDSDSNQVEVDMNHMMDGDCEMKGRMTKIYEQVALHISCSNNCADYCEDYC